MTGRWVRVLPDVEKKPRNKEEAKLLAVIVQAAELLNWLPYHTHNSQRSQPGFPDLFLLRADRIIWSELKSAKGRLTDEQKVWASALDFWMSLNPMAHVEYHLWRPIDWEDGTIRQVLA